MPTKLTNRPDRSKRIQHELETHFGRSYTVDMLMLALGFKEFERSATRQALKTLFDNQNATRTSRGRYMAVRAYRNGAAPVDTTPVNQLPTPALVEEAAKSPEPTPEAKPLAVINDDLSVKPLSAGRPAMFQEYIETVHVIGRAKDDKWIGVGMSDGTLYRLEEL